MGSMKGTGYRTSISYSRDDQGLDTLGRAYFFGSTQLRDRGCAGV